MRFFRDLSVETYLYGFMALSRFLVYGLFDPESGELRYVGRSSSGTKRAQDHLRGSSLLLDDHCHRWIKNLLARGLRPSVEVLEECPISGDVLTPEINAWLNDAEREWIRAAR